MLWTILPHLTACVVNGSITLLDMRQDRYFRVPNSLADESREWLLGGETAPRRFLDLLTRHAILRRHDPEIATITHQTVVVPAGLIDPMGGNFEEAVSSFSIARAVAAARISLRVRRLQSVVEHRRRWRSTLRFVRDETLGQTLAAYHRQRRFVPVRKNCLTDSLALDRWLGVRGDPRRIVFGITTEPFLAHCWLQTDAMLLNDSYDHVRRYAPILVI